MTATLDSPAFRRPSRRAQTIVLLLFLVICLAVEYAAGAVTRPAMEPFYRHLAKPAWTLPDAAFPIVWTVLYILMAVAAWEAWRKAPWAAAGALLPFFVQLALNGAWPFVFFWQGAIALGFVVILALLLAILATMTAFAQRSAAAVWLMVPYALWATYATALNATIVLMNPGG